MLLIFLSLKAVIYILSRLLFSFVRTDISSHFKLLLSYIYMYVFFYLKLIHNNCKLLFSKLINILLFIFKNYAKLVSMKGQVSSYCSFRSSLNPLHIHYTVLHTVQQAGSICIKNLKLKNLLERHLKKKNWAQLACQFAWICEYLQDSCKKHF